MQNVSGDVNTRRESFECLLQKFCLGMTRSKMDVVFELFEWTEEENHQLSEFLQKVSSMKGTLKNSKHRHLTYLFELTCTLAIAPGQNRIVSTANEWELKYVEENGELKKSGK